MTHQDRGSQPRWPLAQGRIPFPDRIPMDVGAGFIVGGAGGSAYHFLRALRTSPSGCRLDGGVQAARANAPRLAGVWIGLLLAYSAAESAMHYARRKEDPWNHIVAFACMRGMYHRRKGLKAAAGSALVGAAFWGVVEVAQIYMDAVDHDPHRKNSLPLPAACSHGDPARAAELLFSPCSKEKTEL